MDSPHECTFCPGNKATCHLTKIVSGQIVEVHVCEKCIPELAEKDLMDFNVWQAVGQLAQKMGVPDPTKQIEAPPVEITAKSLLMPKPAQSAAMICPACGFSSEQLQQVARLGCPHCYEFFGHMILNVIRDCQKGLRHHGKIPKVLLQTKKKAIQELLAKAIELEQFEDAALLRDQLNAMENKD